MYGAMYLVMALGMSSAATTRSSKRNTIVLVVSWRIQKMNRVTQNGVYFNYGLIVFWIPYIIHLILKIEEQGLHSWFVHGLRCKRAHMIKCLLSAFRLGQTGKYLALGHGAWTSRFLSGPPTPSISTIVDLLVPSLCSCLRNK